jgi:quercetin dioxygenase-like cupin family protein
MISINRRAFVGLFAAAALFAGSTASFVAAQSGSPTPAKPITADHLGDGMPANAPNQILSLDRFTVQPGGAFPVHKHPGAFVIWVESGDFTFTVIKGEATITRADGSGTQTFGAGESVVGHPGDVFFEQAGVVHTASNDGSVPTVVLTASLLATDQPMLMPTNDMGTPVS